MDARELYEAAVKLRDEGGYSDVCAVITLGRKSRLLWLSKGQMKREAKKLLRRGVAECLIAIEMNGSTRFKATPHALPGQSVERAEHLLYRFAKGWERYQRKLN